MKTMVGMGQSEIVAYTSIMCVSYRKGYKEALTDMIQQALVVAGISVIGYWLGLTTMMGMAIVFLVVAIWWELRVTVKS